MTLWKFFARQPQQARAVAAVAVDLEQGLNDKAEPSVAPTEVRAGPTGDIDSGDSSPHSQSEDSESEPEATQFWIRIRPTKWQFRLLYPSKPEDESGDDGRGISFEGVVEESTWIERRLDIRFLKTIVVLNRKPSKKEYIGFFHDSEVMWTQEKCFHVECSISDAVFDELWRRHESLSNKTRAVFGISYDSNRPGWRAILKRHPIEIVQVTFYFTEKESEEKSEEAAVPTGSL